MKKITRDDLTELQLIDEDLDRQSLDEEVEQDEREQKEAPMGEPSIIDWM